MVRPLTPHRGFLIPNAGRAGERRLSEPDAVDFNTLGNDRWGVIEGCEVECVGTLAVMKTPGRALVDNALVFVSDTQSVFVPVGSVPKYALLGVTAAGTMTLLDGIPSDQDPVFPDVPANVTVLASVYCPAGAPDLSNYVIDKRTILQSVLHGIAPGNVDFLRTQAKNVPGSNGSAPLGEAVEAWAVRGDGQMRWGAGAAAPDAFLYRSAPEDDHHRQHADGRHHHRQQGERRHGHGRRRRQGCRCSSWHRHGWQHRPNPPGQVSTTQAGLVLGALLQDPTDGEVYILRMDNSTPSKRVWKRLAVSDEIIPAGTILQSLREPGEMTLEGWVPLSGQTITETQYPTLFGVNTLKKSIKAGTPRSMTLPDARNRVLKTVASGAGTTGGSATKALTEANMPPHDHNVRSTPAGVHGHALHIDNSQPISGGGYDYYGAEAAVIISAWGGRNKLDALFNDRSHTYSCEPALLRKPQYSHVTGSIGGAGDHFHSMTESTRGSGTAFNIETPYLTVYTYIRL